MSKYGLDLDYLIPFIDISKRELEEIAMEAEIVITENKETPEKLALAYLKKAQALQKIYECIYHEHIINEHKLDDPLDALLTPISKIQCNSTQLIKELTNKAFELYPDMPEALLQMGKVYHYLEMPETNDNDSKKQFFNEAIKCYTKAIELKPDYAAAYNYRGNIYSAGFEYNRPYEGKQKNIFRPEEPTKEEKRYEFYTDEAVADYTEAIRLRPFDALYYFNRGQTIRNKWGLFHKAEEVIPDFTNVIKYGSDNFKKCTQIFQRRGREYLGKNEDKKAQCDFSECFNNLEDIRVHLSINLPPIMTINEWVSCFLCNNSLRGYSIGSKGLKICSDCLKKMDAEMLSVLSITKEDIEKYKNERKKEAREYNCLPKILSKTISKNKKIRCLERNGKGKYRRSMNAFGLWMVSGLDPITETDIPKDGMADRKLAEDKTCFVCKRNCYVTEVLFMIRSKLWICPDCLKYIDTNDKNISSLSITNEEIKECSTYLDINTPEGKEAHSILGRGDEGSTGIRIISWNCYYGFNSKKAEAIKQYNASILLIPECREKDMETSGYDVKHRYWYGNDKEAIDEHGSANNEQDLGIGIFWNERIIVSPLPQWENTLCKNHDFRNFIPLKVQLDYYAKAFTLIAVWKNDNSGDPCAAIDHYAHIGLLHDRVVIIGDFENNSAVVEKIKQNGLLDCSAINGVSNHSTHCCYTETGEKQVIDDYCFASQDMIQGVFFSVPDVSDWKEENGVKRWNGSDHFPICVEMYIKL